MATARIAIPMIMAAQPSAIARGGGMHPDRVCATADVRNGRLEMTPATTWLGIPMTTATNDGATAPNNPITAKPANTAVAAVPKTDRTSRGTDSRCTLMRLTRREVSGAMSTAAAASTASTMCTANASFSGSGAYCTSRPASSEPRPRPPTLAMVATAAALVRQDDGAASITAAVPVPAKMPADNPDSARPTNSSGTELAMRNTTALASAATTPTSSMGLRPTASDQLPKTTSVTSTPPA